MIMSMKKAKLIKSVDPLWPKWGVVIPDKPTTWHNDKSKAQQLVDAFNQL